MTLQQLNFAIEVAGCNSFNQAAERLYTHQSNVSNVIRNLEDELGIQIFERSRKGISVTDEGREFLSFARDILGSVAFVEDFYAARNRSNRVYFRVSSMRSYFMSVPIIQLQERLMAKGREPVYIRLTKRSFSDVLDDVAYNQAEVGVVFLLSAHKDRIRQFISPKNLEAHSLGETHMNVVVREDHPCLRQKPVMDHIGDYPYILVEETENFGRFYDETSRSVTQMFKKEPQCVISVNDSTISHDIATYTDTFFISSTPWKHNDHYPFISVPLEGDENTLSYFYLLRRHQELSPLARLYIEELKKMFQGL